MWMLNCLQQSGRTTSLDLVGKNYSDGSFYTSMGFVLMSIQLARTTTTKEQQFGVVLEASMHRTCGYGVTIYGAVWFC